MVSFGIYIIFFAALMIAIVVSPALAIVAVFFMFPLDQWAEISIRTYLTNPAFTNYMVAAIVFMALLLNVHRSFIEKGQKFHIGLVFILSALLYFYAYISIYWSPTQYRGRSDWASTLPYIMLLGFTAPILVRSREDVLKIVKYLLVLGVPFAFLLVFYLEWSGRGFDIDGYRETINPLALARFGGYLVIAAACLQGASIRWNALRIAGIIIGLALILKTETRGQLVAAIFCTSFIFLLSYGRVSRYSLIAKSLLAFGVLGGLYFMLSVDSVSVFIIEILGAPEDSKSSTRYDVERGAEDLMVRWQLSVALLHSWLSSPLSIIIGLGNSASYSIVGFYVHNLPIEILGEEGLIGFFIYLAILVLVSYKSFRLLRETHESNSQDKYLWFLPFIALFEFILTLKQGSLISNWPFFMVILLVERVYSIHATTLAIRLAEGNKATSVTLAANPSQDHRRGVA
jgi:O-antigen ligase